MKAPLLLLLPAGLLAALLSGLLLAGAAHADTYRFALLGDTPYSPYEKRELPKMLAAMQGAGAAFAVHIGDLKGGSESCSDALIQERRDLLDAAPLPLIYTPGDNEWQDCSRLLAGHFDPDERLKHLRQLFFAQPRSLGHPSLPLEQQPGEYRENTRWRLGPVLFLTVNQPGPDNRMGRNDAPHPEFLRRNRANLEWLKAGFALARREGLKGVVVATQADPDLEHHASGLPRQGFKDFLDTLVSETENFGGPVVLLHGDTHMARIDHPLRHAQGGARLENFTRVETFGYPIMGWVLGTIDSDDPALFHFSLQPQGPSPFPATP